MKRLDVTKSVMEKVARFEERRTRRWILIFVVILLLILGLISVTILRTYDILSERHTLDLLEILYEDREIIAEFWQDTLLIAYQELPQQTVGIGLGLVAIFIAFWVMTRRRRAIMRRRLAELAKRKKSSNNIL